MSADEQAQKEREAPKTSEMVFENQWLSAKRDVISVDGHQFERISVLHPGAVVVIPIDQDGKIIFARQYRYPINEILIELPAGRIDGEGSIEEEAQRELQEEVGYKAHSLIDMGQMFTAPGFTTEKLYFFIGKDLEASSLEGDLGEVIDVVRLSLEESLDAIKTGSITDMKTIAGILKYQALQHN